MKPTKIILPCRGEFGLKLRYHVPIVHALPGTKMVCKEPWEDCLYPSASSFLNVSRPFDDHRRGMHPRGDTAFIGQLRSSLKREYPEAEIIQTNPKRMREKRFLPEPLHLERGVRADIVICPRGRRYGADKNWGRWAELTHHLQVEGWEVYAAGAPDSSDEVPCRAAWEEDPFDPRPLFLERSISAMRNAKLVISTDAGGAHLAVLCGAPLLLITHEGKVAPGAVRDPEGKIMEPEYWPVRLEEYYLAANHRGSLIQTVDGWMNLRKVVKYANEILVS